MRDNPNSSQISWKAKKNPPKRHTKIVPLFYTQFQRIGCVTYYLQEWNNQNKLDLTMMVHW